MRRSKILTIGLMMIVSLALLVAPAYGQNQRQSCLAGQGPLAPGQERCLIFESGSGIGFPATAITPGLLGDYLIALNKFFFRLAIVLAVLMITIGGFQWLIAIGNASKIANAKETIEQAVIGLVLAMAAYLLFLQIDKSFVPPFKPLDLGNLDVKIDCKQFLNETICENKQITVIDCAWRQKSPTATSTGECLPGLPAQNFVRITWPLFIAQADQLVDRGMSQYLSNLSNLASRENYRMRITEAYPPKSEHEDPRHDFGCAIDMVLEPAIDANKAEDCAVLNRFLGYIRNSRLKAGNEYKGSVCGGTTSKFWTANHLHVVLREDVASFCPAKPIR